MRRVKLLIGIFTFGILVFALTLRVHAVGGYGTICLPGGGCWSVCVNTGDGGSTKILGASQITECSPAYGSACSGTNGNWGVCGVEYNYSSSDCDPTTIDNSYYVYSFYC